MQNYQDEKQWKVAISEPLTWFKNTKDVQIRKSIPLWQDLNYYFFKEERIIFLSQGAFPFSLCTFQQI